MKFNRRIMCNRWRILRSPMLNETPAGHCITIWISIYHDDFCQQRPDWAGSGKVETSYLPAKASSKYCSLLKGLCQISALPTHPVKRHSLDYPPVPTKSACPLRRKPSGHVLTNSDRYILPNFIPRGSLSVPDFPGLFKFWIQNGFQNRG